MTSQDAIDIGTDALVLAAKIAGPFLLVVLGIGLIVGLLQSVTQVQEQTLAFVPKLIGASLVIAISGAWMLEELVSFGHTLMERAPQLING
ncbi:MAG: flagellar biosynthetic protein FliQ [Ilumatobacter sp.]|uniref:flagellar biosynthetic protein FliQ n=1 Tax=Ilumatobacter sp. TaxID=1967498 RepID=UPI00261C62B1|nr:flagellar biosynthetic protein FliQ [Ilumatobacter sp.]MDJ0767438.1 flagellar biosynthetic protein FliQ [Ilumatobacter sp.]